MGDSKRNVVFSTFIKRQFRDVHNIIDVAGGKGELARKLANKGFFVTVIETHSRFTGRKHKNIDYKRGLFSENYNKMNSEMIVGMHPDEATSEIIRYAGKHKLSYAVVPCCIVGKDSKGIGDFEGWLKKLKTIALSQGLSAKEYKLKISGKNIVIFGNPKIKLNIALTKRG